MNINNIKTGDVFLTYGGTFLSKSIRYFMKLFAKKNHIKYDWIASHAATFIWIDNILYLGESVDNGYHLRVFDKHYSFDKDDYCILRSNKSYSKDEESKAISYILHLQTISDFYQYTNFIQWPLYIVFGINTFGKSGSRTTYCYESTYKVLNAVRPDDWTSNLEVIDFFKLYDFTKLKIVIDNRKK
jgi:hypothetical protein